MVVGHSWSLVVGCWSLVLVVGLIDLVAHILFLDIAAVAPGAPEELQINALPFPLCMVIDDLRVGKVEVRATQRHRSVCLYIDIDWKRRGGKARDGKAILSRTFSGDDLGQGGVRHG